MARLKSSKSKKQPGDLLRQRAIYDGNFEELVERGLSYELGLREARVVTLAKEHAEVFRRRVEIIHIFRGLPDRLRRYPSGRTTVDAVIGRLKEIGITCSERTLKRDYSALGGGEFLRRAAPFAEEEKKNSPFIDVKKEEL